MRRIAFIGVVTLLITGTLYSSGQVVRNSPIYPWPIYLISSLADILKPITDGIEI
ncbi:Uncharacterised protein [Pseudomonas putida]|nr:Uncharacterised protein [Pseudomonas putida]